MNKLTKWIYILGISMFIVGLRTTLIWSYTSRLIGFFILCASFAILYYNYIKDKKPVFDTLQINLKQASMGLLLIIIDISYNLYAHDPFRYFDYGMLSAGLIIILLNLGLLRFLKLDKNMIAFATYFIFILLIINGFLLTGLPFILNTTTEEYILFKKSNEIVAILATLFLNLIKTTNVTGNTIDFDGFRVGIGYACSGVESISVFLSAIIAYTISIKEKNIKKMVFYILIGGTALFFINILRVMIIVLVGYYYGTETMYFVHANLGWILFLVVMSVFWYLVFMEY